MLQKDRKLFAEFPEIWGVSQVWTRDIPARVWTATHAILSEDANFERGWEMHVALKCIADPVNVAVFQVPRYVGAQFMVASPDILKSCMMDFFERLHMTSTDPCNLRIKLIICYLPKTQGLTIIRARRGMDLHQMCLDCIRDCTK